MTIIQECARLLKHFNKLICMLEDATALLKTSKVCSVKSDFLSGLNNMPSLHQEIHSSLKKICTLLSLDQSVQRQLCTKQLQSMYRLCMTATGAFLSKAVTELKRLDHTSADGSRFPLEKQIWFLRLWGFTSKMSHGASLWNCTNTDFLIFDLAPLLLPLNNLLTWLQPFTRQQNAPAMQLLISHAEPGTYWQEDVNNNLMLVSVHLGNILADPQQGHLAFSTLPKGFIPKLCCLLCDVCPFFLKLESKACKGKSDRMREEVFCQSVWKLAYFLSLMYCPASQEECDVSDLNCPAAIQVMKLAMVIISKDNLAPPLITDRCPATLQMMLQDTDGCKPIPGATALTQQVTTDQQVITALRLHAVKFRPQLRYATGALHSVMFSSFGSPPATEQASTCAITALRHCYVNLAAWMRCKLPKSIEGGFPDMSALAESDLDGLQSLLYSMCTLFYKLDLIPAATSSSLHNQSAPTQTQQQQHQQLHQQPKQQQQRQCLSVALPKNPQQILCSWQGMTGSFAFLEALIREHPPENAGSMCSCAEVLSLGLCRDIQYPSHHMIPLQISLVTTFIKLLNRPTFESYPSHRTASAQHPMFVNEDDGSNLLTELTKALLYVLTQSCTMDTAGDCIAGCSSSSSVAQAQSSSPQSKATSLNSEISSIGTGGGETSASKVNSNSSNNCASSTADHAEYHNLLKLTAVLVIALVRLENWVLRSDRAKTGSNQQGRIHRPTPEWLFLITTALPIMGSAATQLLLDASQSDFWVSERVSFQHEAHIWEEYGLCHFQGRLLPGCCYLGCCNLSGVSETALPTQLCSGCRRARYCSVQCQQAAWMVGGHGMFCKCSGEFAKELA